jgi:hypothetical protein
MIKSLENNRIWIGGDEKLFEDVQKEAFRLGHGWLGVVDETGDPMFVHQNLSFKNAEDVAWVVFFNMETSNGDFSVMAYNESWAALDFKSDTRGVKITLEDMRTLQDK